MYSSFYIFELFDGKHHSIIIAWNIYFGSPGPNMAKQKTKKHCSDMF